jgi:hypothetical protein
VTNVDGKGSEGSNSGGALDAMRPKAHITGVGILVGMAATPIAAVVGGFALYFSLSLPKARMNSAFDVFALAMFYLIFGSFCASPTTLIGLPTIAAYLPLSPARPVILTTARFLLGWLTMMFWALLLFGIRYYQRLQYGYAAPAFTSFCLVGALCGAVTGLAMGWITLRYSKAPR